MVEARRVCFQGRVRDVKFAVPHEQQTADGRASVFAEAIEDGGHIVEMRATPLPFGDGVGQETIVAVVIVVARAVKTLRARIASASRDRQLACDAATRRDHVPFVRFIRRIVRRVCC